jgi:hypothetical protein
MPRPVRTPPCTKADARVRLRTAQGYLDVAELVLDERQRDEFLSVAAGLAVLAGIAASDSICCTRLGRRHRDDDHRGAAASLTQSVPDGPALASQLLRLLDIKDQAHCGLVVVAPRKARDAMRWAKHLVARAGQELDR